MTKDGISNPTNADDIDIQNQIAAIFASMNMTQRNAILSFENQINANGDVADGVVISLALRAGLLFTTNKLLELEIAINLRLQAMNITQTDLTDVSDLAAFINNLSTNLQGTCDRLRTRIGNFSQVLRLVEVRLILARRMYRIRRAIFMLHVRRLATLLTQFNADVSAHGQGTSASAGGQIDIGAYQYTLLLNLRSRIEDRIDRMQERASMGARCVLRSIHHFYFLKYTVIMGVCNGNITALQLAAQWTSISANVTAHFNVIKQVAVMCDVYAHMLYQRLHAVTSQLRAAWNNAQQKAMQWKRKTRAQIQATVSAQLSAWRQALADIIESESACEGVTWGSETSVSGAVAITDGSADARFTINFAADISDKAACVQAVFDALKDYIASDLETVTTDITIGASAKRSVLAAENYDVNIQSGDAASTGTETDNAVALVFSALLLIIGLIF
jgi:hypothetical protein